MNKSVRSSLSFLLILIQTIKLKEFPSGKFESSKKPTRKYPKCSRQTQPLSLLPIRSKNSYPRAKISWPTWSSTCPHRNSPWWERQSAAHLWLKPSTKWASFWCRLTNQSKVSGFHSLTPRIPKTETCWRHLDNRGGEPWDLFLPSFCSDAILWVLHVKRWEIYRCLGMCRDAFPIKVLRDNLRLGQPKWKNCLLNPRTFCFLPIESRDSTMLSGNEATHREEA